MNTLKYTWTPAAEGDFAAGRHGQTIQSIILHSTCGSKAGDIQTLTGHTDRQVSVHWYVTKAGEIYHFVQDADTAYHAGVVIDPRYSNSCSLGIEQENNGSEPYPDIQVQTVAKLVAALKQKHGLNLEVTAHAHAAAPPGRKTDPAAYPWDKFSAAEKAALLVPWTLVQA
jgi:N-acetylmuramoyl-L-alanine amidase